MKKVLVLLLSAMFFCMTLGLKGAMAAAATDVVCKAPCKNGDTSQLFYMAILNSFAGSSL